MGRFLSLRDARSTLSEKQQYSLTVRVEDQDGLGNNADVTVTVLDVNERPSMSSEEFSVNENVRRQERQWEG